MLLLLSTSYAVFLVVVCHETHFNLLSMLKQYSDLNILISPFVKSPILTWPFYLLDMSKKHLDFKVILCDKLYVYLYLGCFFSYVM